MNSFETWQVVIGCIQVGILLATFAGALYVGIKANEINDRLRVLQDYAAVSVTPDAGSIKLMNVGKVNLYLWGFDIPGNTQRFERPRLLPAGTNDSSYYWIGAPDVAQIKDDKFEFRLYLTDQFGNKWISDAGGDVTRTKVQKDEKQLDAVYLKVWSYDTRRQEWSF